MQHLTWRAETSSIGREYVACAIKVAIASKHDRNPGDLPLVGTVQGFLPGFTREKFMALIANIKRFISRLSEQPHTPAQRQQKRPPRVRHRSPANPAQHTRKAEKMTHPNRRRRRARRAMAREFSVVSCHHYCPHGKRRRDHCPNCDTVGPTSGAP